MNSSKRIGSRLVFAMALIGVLCTRFISADDETTTAINPTRVDQATEVEVSIAPTEGETAPPEAQETQETVDQTSNPADRLTGEGGAQTETSSAPGNTGDGETRAMAQESSPAGRGAEETTTAAGQLGRATTGTLLPPGTEGETTGSSLAEFSTAGIGGTGDGETSKPTEVKHTDGVGSIKSVHRYTTGRTETDETTASVKKTSETATTATTATPVGQTSTDERKETTAVRNETEKILFSATESPDGCTNSSKKCRFAINASGTIRKIHLSASPVKADKTQRYIRLVILNETNHIEKTLEPWKAEWDCQYTCMSLGNELIRKLMKAIGKPSGKRIRRQTSEETPNTDDSEIILHFPENLTSDEIEKAFKSLLPEIKEEPQQVSTSSGEVRIQSTLHPYPKTYEEQPKPSIWEAHFGLFLTVIILIAVCIVVTAVCCLCMTWRGRDQHQDKQPIAMEEAHVAPTAVSNPIPDVEMIHDEVQMQERENPAVTPNGGGQHISKAEEDNGWVVPLDELSKAEKEKPEVENTRL